MLRFRIFWQLLLGPALVGFVLILDLALDQFFVFWPTEREDQLCSVVVRLYPILFALFEKANYSTRVGASARLWLFGLFKAFSEK